MASDKIVTPTFRAAFADVFKAKAFQGGEPKFSVTMLFKKGTNLDALKKLAQDKIEERWPDKSKRPKGLKTPFRDGDTVEWDGFAGHIFAKASSLYPPGVVDQQRQVIITPDGFYSGCHARASINAFAYDTMGNQGVSFGLQNLQFVKDDEPFSGRTAPEDDFDELPDEGGAAAPEGIGDLGDLG